MVEPRGSPRRWRQYVCVEPLVENLSPAEDRTNGRDLLAAAGGASRFKNRAVVRIKVPCSGRRRFADGVLAHVSTTRRFNK
jgi:hypothetical protein